jgi:hypothetical protein
MALDLSALSTALKRFTDNVTARISDADAAVKADIESLMTQLTDEYNASVEVIQGESEAEGSAVAINEKFLDLGAGNAIDASLANHYGKTITGATTLSVSNASAEKVTTFILHLTNGGTNVTWWSGIRWSNGTKPTLTASGRDVLAFTSKDGGVTWDGFLVGQDMKAAA